MVSLESNDEALNQNEKNNVRYMLENLDLTPNNDEKVDTFSSAL